MKLKVVYTPDGEPVNRNNRRRYLPTVVNEEASEGAIVSELLKALMLL
jgi:hypothetical protein